MPYQFFAKHPYSASPTSPPLARPQPAYNPRHNRPPIHHPSPFARQQPSAKEAPKPKEPANANAETSFQPRAYPDAIVPGYQTPHPNITVEPISTAHIPSLTRITGLLLPIRYPNSFYTATVTDPVIASVSRVAIYHDHHHQHSVSPAATTTATAAGSANTGTDKVIGGIRCRLERLPSKTTELLSSQSRSRQEPANLYVQTLHLLSPYRGHGVATALLNALLFDSAPTEEGGGGGQVSGLVKHYNIRTVTAHVHEANDDALRWYIARGFSVEEGVVENYYRRLSPSGARIVKLVLHWNDRPEDAHVASRRPGPERKHRADVNDDDDWEKVEAEDADEHDDHGVRPLSGSRELDADDGERKKRKTSDDDDGRLVQ
jgi:ribosomal protein S18 acetylase RimI-like enzyme